MRLLQFGSVCVGTLDVNRHAVFCSVKVDRQNLTQGLICQDPELPVRHVQAPRRVLPQMSPSPAGLFGVSWQEQRQSDTDARYLALLGLIPRGFPIISSGHVQSRRRSTVGARLQVRRE
jgi:hypothetical protein